MWDLLPHSWRGWLCVGSALILAGVLHRSFPEQEEWMWVTGPLLVLSVLAGWWWEVSAGN